MVLASYCVAAVLFSWPLALHLGTHLTGPPAGDTGVYVWNQWVFQHELLDHRQLPYFTDTLFGARRTANLGLHNYTTFQNLLALPFIRVLGVVETFNIVYLLMTVLTAYAVFLLARDVTGADAEAWLAGLLFGWSPILITRGMGHFSLVAAAPLAIFLLLLRRAAKRHAARDALLLGATVWWAASTDVYYAVYCVVIAFVFTIARIVVLERPTQPTTASIKWALDLLALSVAGLLVAMLVGGGWKFSFLGRPVGMHRLYTPTLVLTALVLIRVCWGWRTSLGDITRLETRHFFRTAAASSIVAAILLSPFLYSIFVLLAEGQFNRPGIMWRSSPPGVDLLSFLIPNPNHPLTPDGVPGWLAATPTDYLENVTSFPLVALGLLVVAWRKGWRPSRCGFALAVVFALLSLGPFVIVGGINTHVPGPWALLRYVPIVGLARMPARFAIVAMLMLAVLFASALRWMTAKTPAHRRTWLATMSILVIFELWPSPRPLYSAQIPAIYQQVSADPRDVTVLELPFGVRDGTSNVGAFTARTQYFQTAHGKPILGGYLSRVAKRHVLDAQSDPVLSALMLLSENKTLSPERLQKMTENAQALARSRRIGYVVFDVARMPPDFQRLAISAFHLRLAGADNGFALYTPEF